MNKGIKTIGTIVSLLLLSVLLFVILISAIYPLPFQLERFRFFSLTNFYLRHSKNDPQFLTKKRERRISAG